MGEQGLRERKKARTRQRISNAATALFIARGFDNVSVAEVAEAADVAKMTVFNYFPRKEDLMLDRHPELRATLTDAITGRADTEPPLTAVRRMLIALARERHPLSGIRDHTQPFFQTVLDSPALLARAREQQQELEDTLADLLAEDPHSADPRLIAAWVVASYRTTFITSIRRILAGEHGDDIAEDHVARIDQAFHALEHAAAALGPTHGRLA